MPAYETAWFNPPAPLARVTLRNPRNGGLLSDVPMLLDTGSDVTLLLAASVARLGVGVIAGESYELEGFDGNASFAPAAQLELLFLQRTFRGKHLSIAQECGILGRDILNLLSLLFDGPQLSWSDHRPTVKK